MKKIFTNDKFFLGMTLLGCISFLVGGIMIPFLYPGNVTYLSLCCIQGLCILFLYSSYRKHSKNVMKGLMGALLMAGLLNAISLASDLIIPADKVFAPLALVFFVCLFVTHYFINSNHHSKPGLIRLNQLMCVLLAVVWLVWHAIWAAIDENALVGVMSIAVVFGRIGLVCVIVCVESRLDAYRIEREANGYKAE